MRWTFQPQPRAIFRPTSATPTQLQNLRIRMQWLYKYQIMCLNFWGSVCADLTIEYRVVCCFKCNGFHSHNALFRHPQMFYQKSSMKYILKVFTVTGNQHFGHKMHFLCLVHYFQFNQSWLPTGSNAPPLDDSFPRLRSNLRCLRLKVKDRRWISDRNRDTNKQTKIHIAKLFLYYKNS